MTFKPPQFYADSVVVAFKVPASEVTSDNQQAKMTWSSGTIDPALLSDGDLVKTVPLPKAPEGERAWIQYEYAQPQTIRAVTIVVFGKGPLDAFLPPGGESGQALKQATMGRLIVELCRSRKAARPKKRSRLRP